MRKQVTYICAVLGLGVSLSLAGSAVPGAEARPNPPCVPAQEGAREGVANGPGSTSSETRISASKTQLAAARRSTTPRTRRRHRQPPLRLPAVTQYGIPRLHVTAAYVIDATNNRVLFQKNQGRVLPIASLTKLMTAMVFLRTQPEWDRVIEIVPEDVKNSSRTRIRAREEITVRDLIHASLMSSDNCATKALVRTCGVPRDEFVRRMNSLADSLKLVSTHFVEPTGLSEQNVSTAQDLAQILQAASVNEVVSAITQKTDYSFTTNRRMHHLVNTNRLLRSQYDITSGKTGFIREAGYCLVTNVKGPTGIDITAVVLGAPSNALRFAEARRILDWTFRFGLARLETTPESD